DLRARFELEARVTGSISSDHVVRTFDAGVDESSRAPFLVLELLEGDELGKLLRRKKLLPPREAIPLLMQTAMGLAKMHAAGIVHRDLKPENLFVTMRDDGTPCLKILDFGVAKIVSSTGQTKTTSVIGTPTYMSPEQIVDARKVNTAADIYALAQIAFAML